MENRFTFTFVKNLVQNNYKKNSNRLRNSTPLGNAAVILFTERYRIDLNLKLSFQSSILFAL